MITDAIYRRVTANRHTSAAGVVGLVCLSLEIAEVWLPQYEKQLSHTARILGGGALSYGLLMAEDARQQPPPPSTNTKDTAKIRQHETNS